MLHLVTSSFIYQYLKSIYHHLFPRASAITTPVPMNTPNPPPPLQSVNSRHSSVVIFTNRCDVPVKLYWCDAFI